MTFLEAAIEILRQADGPLHFGEIAKQAVDQDLLSHVGRDPETAMRSCLTSAVRSGPGGSEPVIERTKPGYYQMKPESKLSEAVDTSASKKKTSPKKSASTTKKRRPGTTSNTTAKPEAEVTATLKDPSRLEVASPSGDPEKGATELSEDSDGKGKAVAFAAPEGSGLEGVTDIAVVMANAMSRIVEERPELKEELQAMQSRTEEPRDGETIRRVGRRTVRSRDTLSSTATADRGNPRKRRRRKRKTQRRIEWGNGSQESKEVAVHEKLLDEVQHILGGAGPRAMHIRQIAEGLAAKGLLDGEISELERAVTTAILLERNRFGSVARIEPRGEGRFQLRGAILPQEAALSEQALYQTVRQVEQQTKIQISKWLQSLSARALESIVRVYLELESYKLIASLPPGRGIGRLIVEDLSIAEDREPGKTYVCVVPNKVTLTSDLWRQDEEGNGCSQTLVFTMGDEVLEDTSVDATFIYRNDLVDWLLQHRIGVKSVKFQVSVLDEAVIEAIGGLDS